MTLRQPTSEHGGNARFDEEVTKMGGKRRAPATGSEAPRSDHVVIKIEADSTDEELEVMAEAVIEWIMERDPDFFLPEED